MSKLKCSENLFLEVNELNRLVKFIEDDGWKRAFKAIVCKYGIVKNAENNYFKPIKKTNEVLTINSGLAFDSDMNAIVSSNATDIVIQNSGVKKWVVIQRSITNEELGTVSVTSNGIVSGVGTEFTKVLRGGHNFPTKMKLVSNQNVGTYEVVSVISNTQAIISGALAAESNVKYKVIGTFTPGYQVSEYNSVIYEYDSFEIRILESQAKPILNQNQYLIASVSFDNGVMNVTDERGDSMFNVSDNKYNYVGNNPLASLTNVNLIGNRFNSADIELIVEHGYKVLSYTYSSTNESVVFTINQGSSNFLNSSTVPDGMFSGWLLLNRDNMKYAKITNNSGNSLTVPDFNSEFITENSDFVVVPDCRFIEYEVKMSGGVANNAIPFYFTKSVENINSRLNIYALHPDAGGESSVVVVIKYRMIDASGEKHSFKPLAVANYRNIDGDYEMLSNGQLTLNISNVVPTTATRNYS